MVIAIGNKRSFHCGPPLRVKLVEEGWSTSSAKHLRSASLSRRRSYAISGKTETTSSRAASARIEGLGVGAFAYYRRVVENHKNEIFDEIIKVCETVGASQELIEELDSAKKEISFARAMGQVKTALPQGLRINGHDPLLALHNALSIGLHNESDAKCLETANDVRLVLTELIEKMSLLRQEKSELGSAVHRLIAKKGGT